MSNEPKLSDETLAQLKQLRDELAVQVSLGKAEAKDEWAKLEKKYEELQEKSAPVAHAAENTADNVGAALELAAGELKNGYEQIRKLL